MTDYSFLCQSLAAITEGVPYETANLANASALLWEHLPDLNWAGFYKMIGEKLVLGPFQGKPPALKLKSAAESAEPLLRKTKHSLFIMYMNSRDILPATALPIRKLSFRFMSAEKSGACSISTARLSEDFPKMIKPVLKNS